jgi:hypothetical protein
MNSNISYTLNTSSRKSRFRPNSASKRQLNIFKKNISRDTPPPILYTLPNTQQKKRSGMGNKIEREELYEYNMQLKDIINNLKKELAEVKHKVVKKDIEIRKKEKLIKECSKENDIESNHELNLEKARESTLISLYKKQYNELRESFNKKVKENNELNATYKITKLKEYAVQIDVMKKEMEKMRNLYRQTVENNNKLTLEIQSLKELKKFFIEQHGIIDKLEQTILKNKEEIQNLKQENDDYRNKLEQNLKKQKILKSKNFKLKLSNKKFLDIKKNRENYELYMDDNKKTIENLKKDCDEYKRLYELTRKEYNTIVEQRDKKEQNKIKNEENLINPFKAMGIIEVKKENEETNKLSLYKSLVEEYKVKIDIYEVYLKKIGIDKDALIKAFGYDGVVSASTKINPNELENINNNNNLVSIEANPNNNINPESSEENFVQTGDNLSTANTNTNTNTNNINRNSVSTSNNFNNNNNDNKLPSIEEEKQDDAQYTDENQLLSLLHVFVKNLESNGVTKEQINQKIDEISKLFENRTEATKEEFIEPFLKMLVESMHITKKEDIEVVEGFLNDFVDALNGDISVFFNGLIEVFDNINDYSGTNKDCELSFKLSKYKDELITSLQKCDANNTHLITFDTFRKIVHDLNLLLDDESMEYLIYRMKKDVPENNSIFDLNYEIIEKLLTKNEIKDTLGNIKKILEEKNTNLDAECLELINTFEYQGKKFMIVKKEDFFAMCEKMELTLSPEVMDGIYNCFKIEVDGEGIEKQDWIDYERLKVEIEDNVGI